MLFFLVKSNRNEFLMMFQRSSMWNSVTRTDKWTRWWQASIDSCTLQLLSGQKVAGTCGEDRLTTEHQSASEIQTHTTNSATATATSALQQVQVDLQWKQRERGREQEAQTWNSAPGAGCCASEKERPAHRSAGQSSRSAEESASSAARVQVREQTR